MKRVEERSFLGRFNSRLPWPLRAALVLAAGLVLVQGVVHGLPVAYYALHKAMGDAPDCPWSRILTLGEDSVRFEELSAEARAEIAEVEREPSTGLVRVSIDGRTYWTPDDAPTVADNIVAFITAEYRHMEEMNSENWVRPGEIVVDCGAHVGIFTHRALEAGASKVIAVEPDPRNITCLKRNFPEEIASGKVVIAPLGVWSSESKLELTVDSPNSGMHTLVHGDAARTIEVRVTPMDRLVDELGLERVDFIKMDIEGAEQEALKGAAQTLARFQPRLAIASYHREDDFAAIPAIIRGNNAAYRMECGPCAPSEFNDDVMIPHMTYYE